MYKGCVYEFFYGETGRYCIFHKKFVFLLDVKPRHQKCIDLEISSMMGGGILSSLLESKPSSQKNGYDKYSIFWIYGNYFLLSCFVSMISDRHGFMFCDSFPYCFTSCYLSVGKISSMKNFNSFVELSIVVLLMSTGTLAQSSLPASILDPSNQEIRNLTSSISQNGWLYFNENSKLRPGDLMQFHKSALGLTKEYLYIETSRENDGNGYEIIGYQQTFEGIPIEGATLVENVNKNFVKYVNGEIIQLIKPSIIANISSVTALKASIDVAAVSDRFSLQNKGRTDERTDKDFTPYIPEPELIFASKTLNHPQPQDYILCWKTVVAPSPASAPSLAVYIDASTGKVVRQQPLDIYTTELSKGLYFINAINNDGHVASKIIKQ